MPADNRSNPNDLPSEAPTLELGSAPVLNSEHATLLPATNIRLTAVGQPLLTSAVSQTVAYFGDYELLGEIARGGMGVVYKARQVNLNRIVALKMILAGQLASQDDVKRFYTEAEAAAALDHPGIVPIFEIGQHEEQHFFSMGFVDGGSLSDKLKDGPLKPEDAAEYTKKVAEAIAYAHAQGVIHRDLKPANVLLDQSNQPKVTDFGLARRTESNSDLTRTGAVMGTPSYMPPEQASGKTDEVGPLADVYSLGAILYCLLTGRPPFQASNPLETLMQVIQREPLAPSELTPTIPKDLETICLKCLQKDPARRYASAQDLTADLGRWQRGEPIRARAVSITEKAYRWVKRNRLVAGLLGSLGFVLVSATLISAVFASIALSGWRSASREQQLASRRSSMELSLSYGDQQMAEERLHQLLTDYPREQQTKDAIVSFVVQTDSEQKIEKYSLELKNRWPQEIFAHLNIGDRFFKQNKPKQAIEFYMLAYEQNPRLCNTVYALGRDFSTLKRHEEALPFLNVACETCEGSVLYDDSRYYQILAFINTGQINEAKRKLDTFIQEFPEEKHFISDILSEFVIASDDDLASHQYQQYLQDNRRGQAHFYYCLAEGYLERRRFVEAEKSSRMAIDLNEEWIDARILLCRVLVDSQRFEESLSEAKKLSDRDLEPWQVGEINELIVRSYLEGKQINEADRFTSELMQKEPRDKDIRSLRMRVLEEIRSSVFARENESKIL